LPISNDLLEILCCPKTKVPVVMLSAEQLEQLNSRIAGGHVEYVGSGSVDQPLTEGLITEDNQTIYRIDEGIPVMLIDKGIAASQLQD
jgi:uncharacterized protein YbaR (Trm112 family)